MNSKNALFLAATLTAFALAILFAVVNKVTTTPIEAAAAPAVQDTATTVPTDVVPTDVPTNAPTAMSELGPLEAAQIAANSINHTDVYSVETFKFNDLNSYKVVFSSGSIVYVGMDRTILDSAKLAAVVTPAAPAQVIVYAAPAAPVKKHKSSGGGSNPSPQPGPTEPHDD